MSFALPIALLSLLVVPLLLGGYVRQLRRRRRQAIRHSSVALLALAVPRRPRWTRHLPAALLLSALALLAVAAARPQASVSVPLGRTTIILALDVSRSMCATDVDPNRLTVAQDAATDFVAAQPGGTRIGIVAFSGFAQLIVPPTTDRAQLQQAIAALTTSRGTAIGSAILTSIDAIAEINADVAPVGNVGDASDAGAAGNEGDAGAAGGPAAEPLPAGQAGQYVPDIVVLLTDGANTRGVEPLEVVPEAAARGVRVYTIGFGTTEPTDLACSRAQLGGDVLSEGFDRGGFGGPGDPGFGGGPPRSFLVIDEPTLQQVAADSGGEYYRAESAEQLVEVFDALPRDVELQSERREITMVFTLAGAVLAAAALLAASRFSPRP